MNQSAPARMWSIPISGNLDYWRSANVKTLSEKDLIELLPVGETDALDGAKLFESLLPASCRGEGFLHRSVSLGHFTCEQIAFNGKPAFLFWWHKSVDDGLWIDACQTYFTDVPIKVAFLAAELLRSREKCGYVRFMTTRAGLATESQKHGYEVEGLILVNKI
jgi:hypothetical protein